MTLVMDGVRRSSVVRSSAAVTAMPLSPGVAGRVGSKPAMRPLSAATQRATAGVRYATGIDGLRRPVVAPSPREIMETLVAPVPAAAPVAPAAPATKPWQAKTAVAFGLVATALIASGVAAFSINSRESVATQAAAPTPVKTAPALAATPAPTPDQRQAALQQLLNDFAAGQSAGGHFNIVVKDLKTGLTASINPDQSFASASLYKLFVAHKIYRQIDTGQLTYGAGAGSGTGRNIQGCLDIMITVSDNGCGNALGNILGWGKQNTGLKADGFNGTNLATLQQTNARDVAILFERLYQGTLNSPNSNEAFMTLLKRQRVNNRLPIGLPAGTQIAHKTGDLYDVIHDAGIVYGPKTDYLVVVMSGGWKSPGTTPPKFANLSRQLWSFFQQ